MGSNFEVYKVFLHVQLFSNFEVYSLYICIYIYLYIYICQSSKSRLFSAKLVQDAGESQASQLRPAPVERTKATVEDH